MQLVVAVVGNAELDAGGIDLQGGRPASTKFSMIGIDVGFHDAELSPTFPEGDVILTALVGFRKNEGDVFHAGEDARRRKRIALNPLAVVKGVRQLFVT